MAGYMYLGSQRVCPAVVSGGSEPTEYFTFKFPDNMVEPPQQSYYISPQIEIDYSNLEPACVDFNNIKVFSGNLSPSSFGKVPLIPKVEKIEKLTGKGLVYAFKNCLALEGHKDIVFESLVEVDDSAIGCAFLNQTTKTFENIYFPKLTKIGSTAFVGFGNKGVNVYFNAVTSATFPNGDELEMFGFQGEEKTLHFPSNLSSVIPNQSGYPNFGATTLTILYDLEPTEN